MTENNQHQQPSKGRLSDHEVEEKSADAREILYHPVFKGAVEDVYSRAEGILLEAEVGSLTASAAHATMKAITDIRNQLEQYVNDYKMRKKYPTG